MFSHSDIQEPTYRYILYMYILDPPLLSVYKHMQNCGSEQRQTLQARSKFMNRNLSQPEYSATVVLPYQPINQ